MAEGKNPPEPFDEDTYHRQLIWEEFLERAVDAGNKAIGYLNLEDYSDEMVAESTLEEVYMDRWRSAGDIVTSAFNFLWPEIESLAIKLGVPFEPEIMEIHGIEDDN